MWQMMLPVLAFLMTILILVGVHEAGHFFVARLFKVPVKRFSIGFGKPLVKWQDAKKTEYAIGWLPLGGYVSLADYRIEPELFIRPPAIWQRFLIILAGPAINMLLALILFYGVFLAGFTYVKPIIEKVAPGSIAAVAGIQPGQLVVQVDGRRVHGWQEVNMLLIEHLGSTQQLNLTIEDTSGHQQNYQLALKNWQVDPYRPNLLNSLGLVPLLPKADQPEPNKLFYTPQYSWVGAIGAAARHFYFILSFNLQILYKLIAAKISLGFLSGPIGLYEISTIAAKEGLKVFADFLGIVSIGLGVINLLPIPGLDGSQIIYLLIEKIRKKPFSVAFENLLFQLGMIVVFILISQAFSNDLLRLA